MTPYPGRASVLILDNCSIHKVQPFVDRVRAKGYRLIFLPPYSPSYNPIENVFSALKAGLRRMGYEWVCSVGVPQAVEIVLQSLTSETCCNLIRRCGYYIQ